MSIMMTRPATIKAKPTRTLSHRTGDDESRYGVVVEPETIRLSINGFRYEVREVPAYESGSVAFELHKLATNNRYHVIRDHYGLVRCDCGDYQFRHEGTAGTCKHGKALVAKGLVEAPNPIPSTVRRRVSLSPTVSTWRNATPDRVEYPAKPTRRRFEPSAEEMAEAAQLFGDLAAERVDSYRREYAAAL